METEPMTDLEKENADLRRMIARLEAELTKALEAMAEARRALRP